MFNVDESGFQSFIDAVSISVVIPTDRPDDTVPYSVVRNWKHASLISCISADGSLLRPTFVVSRKRIAANLKFYVKSLAKIPTLLILQYSITGRLKHSFKKSKKKRKKRMQLWRRWFTYVGRLHFSLLRFFPRQMYLFQCLSFEGAPRTSNQIQPLDLGIFGQQKTLKREI